MTGKERPADLFARAWKASQSLLDDEEKLKSQLPPRERAKIERNIRRLNGIITPHKTTFAANANRPVIRACSRYFEQFGLPEDFGTLSDWLDQQGLLSGLTEDGKRWRISETKLRRLLHKAFDGEEFDLWGNPLKKS
jgi:hypothetical protein